MTLVLIVFLALAGPALAADCDFFQLYNGYLQAADGSVIDCMRWPSLQDAKEQCLNNAACDGFTFAYSCCSSLGNYEGCIYSRRDGGFVSCSSCTGYYKTWMGCTTEDSFDGRLCPSDVLVTKPTLGTAQSSTEDCADAKRAIDGRQYSIYNCKSCTHTKYEQNPWWGVNLGGTYTITRVEITNRQDCCWTRLSSFNIYVSPTADFRRRGILCQQNVGVGRETKSFACPAVGRFVVITIPGWESLTLCEVRVYASSSVPTEEAAHHFAVPYSIEKDNASFWSY